MGNVLTAKEREISTNSNLKMIREKGGIPAVLYGDKQGSTSIEVDTKALRAILRETGKNGIIELKLGSDTRNVMLTDYQYDSLKNEFIHADFLAVNLDKKLTAGVALVLTGTAKGVKLGGVLQQALYEVSVTARPQDLPENIEVEVSGLGIGDLLTVGDIKDQVNLTIEDDDSEVIASVLAPRTDESAIEAEAEETEQVN
ncbi:MAG: 50S ribosomal protein L25/general stress protein Ctc [Bacillus sp. (in: firmicutes)]